MINVLIVDDSPTIRLLIRKILESDLDITVAGEARDGEEAIALCGRLSPDILTMDLHMPGVDGYEVIRHIMAEMPCPILALTANAAEIRSGVASRAVESGALAVLDKPGGMPGEDPRAGLLLRQLKVMAGVKVVGRRNRSRDRPADFLGRKATASGAGGNSRRLVAVGVSTGGPQILQMILSRLPAGFPVPVLVVQHISRGFVTVLANWLNGTTPLSVKVASIGEPLVPGTVYLAPDDKHLIVGPDDRVWFKSMPPVDGHCPSATVLFESVAARYGPAAVGVILTGMGVDGAGGLGTIHDAGGYSIAQEEASCVVFGMPKAAIALGVVNEILPPAMIADRLKALMSRTG
jgi:two-component system, chemotaxis family, protein-glutamate methylesterase/glutaminase